MKRNFIYEYLDSEIKFLSKELIHFKSFLGWVGERAGNRGGAEQKKSSESVKGVRKYERRIKELTYQVTFSIQYDIPILKPHSPKIIKSLFTD